MLLYFGKFLSNKEMTNLFVNDALFSSLNFSNDDLNDEEIIRFNHIFYSKGVLSIHRQPREIGHQR